MRTPIFRRALVNRIGIGILLVGMGLADFLYWRSLQGGTGDDPISPSPYDSRVYEQDVQRTIGTFGLLLDEWSRAVARIREPRILAITIGVVAILSAAGCFLAASRMPPD